MGIHLVVNCPARSPLSAIGPDPSTIELAPPRSTTREPAGPSLDHLVERMSLLRMVVLIRISRPIRSAIPNRSRRFRDGFADGTATHLHWTNRVRDGPMGLSILCISPRLSTWHLSRPPYKEVLSFIRDDCFQISDSPPATTKVTQGGASPADEAGNKALPWPPGEEHDADPRKRRLPVAVIGIAAGLVGGIYLYWTFSDHRPVIDYTRQTGRLLGDLHRGRRRV
jgi:hypothetical protein